MHVGRNPGGVIIVPTQQRLDPVGVRIGFDGRPNALAASPDGKTLAVMNTDSLEILDPSGARTSYPYPGERGKKGTVEAASGIAFAPDGSTIYVCTVANAVERFDARSRGWRSPIVFKSNVPTFYEDTHDKKTSDTDIVGSLPTGIAVSPDGRTLYVALNANNQVVAVDAASGRAIAAAHTGVAPVDLVLAGSTLAVLNWGGRFPRKGDITGEGGYTGQPVLIDPKTGVASSGEVTLLDARTLRVRAQIPVGRHPFAATLVGPHTLIVADANDDALQTIDLVRGRVLGSMPVRLPGEIGWGLQPQALAISPHGSRLYVALAGANAVAAYDASNPERLRFIGASPTDWYPGALALLHGGMLAVANLKGIGSLGSVSNDPPARDDVPRCSTDTGATWAQASLRDPQRPAGTFDVHNYRGTIDLISAAQLGKIDPSTTRETVRLATWFRPAQAASLPAIRHVLYIIRENKTYDQVLGDLPQGNGDPRLVSFPRRVTPNTHALVEQFVLLDNYYDDGVQSNDGHQWTDEAAATDYIERSFPSQPRSYPNQGTDPLAYAGSGFLWDNALRHGLSVRDYGEFAPVRFVPGNATWAMLRDHRARVVTSTRIPVLESRLDTNYPGFSRRVSDQIRADEFIREYTAFEAHRDLPNLMIMSLGDDHTQGFDPGYPTPCAMMADNDNALGRIVQAISHSADWRNTLILVTEDDSQDGYDHVDGHRTEGLMFGPMVKRGAVVHDIYSQISMVRTAEAALGLPPMNRFDASAPVMSDALTTHLDLRPYTAIAPNIPLGQMNPRLAVLRGEVRRLAIDSRSWNPDDPDDSLSAVMRRTLWLATHPPTKESSE